MNNKGFELPLRRFFSTTIDKSIKNLNDNKMRFNQTINSLERKDEQSITKYVKNHDRLNLVDKYYNFKQL